jgi:hypothetical protein
MLVFQFKIILITRLFCLEHQHGRHKKVLSWSLGNKYNWELALILKYQSKQWATGWHGERWNFQNNEEKMAHSHHWL